MFAAAANSGARNPVAWPARHRDVFCIHASDGDGKGASFTPPPRTPGLDFSMLGVAVLSTWPDFRNVDSEETARSSGIFEQSKRDGTVKRVSGTSMATPLAAALAANILTYTLIHNPRSRYFGKWSTVRTAFLGMSEIVDGHHNLVPWTGEQARFEIAYGNRVDFHSAIEDTLLRVGRDQ